MSSDLKRSQFLTGGCDRARSATEPDIRREVEAEFTKRWPAASTFGRWLLRRRIEAEIERRLEARAPSEALY